MFSGLHCCSVIKELAVPFYVSRAIARSAIASLIGDSFVRIPPYKMDVNNFFQFFLKNFQTVIDRTFYSGLSHILHNMMWFKNHCFGDIKRNAFAFPLITKAEKEGFEPSRRSPDLHP